MALSYKKYPLTGEAKSKKVPLLEHPLITCTLEPGEGLPEKPPDHPANIIHHIAVAVPVEQSGDHATDA